MGNGTSIGRVRGLGSAHHGAHHWLVQRFTAVGNIVLGLWLAGSLALLTNRSYDGMMEWLAQPISAVAMALFIVSTFWHARLGLQVLIEDYVEDSAMRFAVFAVLNFLAFGGAALGLFFILQIVMAGPADPMMGGL